MSSLLQNSSTYNELTGTAIAGTNLYQLGKNIQHGMEGDADKVHFIRNNVTCVEFDATLQETHGVQNKPTEFPVESGAIISDHIIVAPIELQLTCIVSDTPIGLRPNLIQSVYTTALNAVAGPLGVITQNAALRFLSAHNAAKSRSQSVYEDLLRLCAGDPTSTPPCLPTPFDVVTKLRRYPSMVLKSISVPQDITTGQALVYTMALQQIRVVTPKIKTIKQFAAPVVATPKQERGELEALQDKVSAAVKKGVNEGDTVTFHEKTYKDL